jgi:GT2 family glycosyltransferase/peptidoglycan/xylan/chitin deacetylase (PgdA/CDA1 family)
VKLSVVIPTYNRRDLLAATLEALLGQRFPPDQYEVVVAVDGATDGTDDLLRARPDPRLVVTAGPNLGPAAARNRALAIARGRLVLFLDDDIVCPPDLLAVHAAAHDGPEPRLVFGPILVDEASPPGLATEWTRRHSLEYVARLNREGAPRADLDAYVDANSSLPRAALRAAGGFDERLHRQCETADLGLRLWKDGVRFVWEPRAVVRHVFVKTVDEVVRSDAGWQGRNEPMLVARHPELRARSALALVGQGSAPRRLLRQALTRAPLSVDRALALPTRAAERLAGPALRASTLSVAHRAAPHKSPLPLGAGLPGPTGPGMGQGDGVKMRAGSGPQVVSKRLAEPTAADRDRTPTIPAPDADRRLAHRDAALAGRSAGREAALAPRSSRVADLATDLGVGLLRARQGIAFYRAAAEAVGGWATLRRDYGRRLPTLLYHYVGCPPTGLPGSLVAEPAAFERQVATLASLGYVGIRAAEWLAWLERAAPLPARAVLLTFDDAYAALEDWALPVLRRHGWSATVFVVTGQVGGTNRWDDLPLPLASAERLRAWASGGVELGAHGRRHRALPGLSAADLADEVDGSRSDLEALLGAPVTSFAYPYGRVDAAASAAVGAAFPLAFTTEPGTAALADDRARLPRTMVLPGDTTLDLLARALLGHSPLQPLRAALGRLAGRP